MLHCPAMTEDLSMVHILHSTEESLHKLDVIGRLKSHPHSLRLTERLCAYQLGQFYLQGVDISHTNYELQQQHKATQNLKLHLHYLSCIIICMAKNTFCKAPILISGLKGTTFSTCGVEIW